ncbi:endocuticle structural glycoprotein SgAbd-9-like [Anabrus simplex]|uniref:endocuticle structural glycoprotein SgAbd-9-like n=1 Tax=Anabrus simplex TaxID=316456 RepID=UPI0035A28E39
MMIAAVFIALAAVASAAPQATRPFVGPVQRPFLPAVPPAFVPILSQNFDLNVDGSYNFNYESADGSARQESGVLNNPGTPAEASAVTGSYTYIGTDGVPVTVNYIADENGFQPIGNIIAPQISRAVADQVAFARSNPLPPVQPFNRFAPSPALATNRPF